MNKKREISSIVAKSAIEKSKERRCPSPEELYGDEVYGQTKLSVLASNMEEMQKNAIVMGGK